MVAYKKLEQRKKGLNERLRREREIRSSLLILDLKDDKLQDSGKQDEGKMFYRIVAFIWRCQEGIVRRHCNGMLIWLLHPVKIRSGEIL